VEQLDPQWIRERFRVVSMKTSRQVPARQLPNRLTPCSTRTPAKAMAVVAAIQAATEDPNGS
jgi:hypothetical protein